MLKCCRPEEDRLKSAEEIMEILDAYDLTGSLRDASELAGRSHNTDKRYVRARDAGGVREAPERRDPLIDPLRNGLMSSWAIARRAQ